MRTPSSLRVHVLPNPELRPTFDRLKSGQDLNVTGIWLSRGAGAARSASAAAAGVGGGHAGHAALLPAALQRLQMANAWAAAGAAGNSGLAQAASVAPDALSVYCFMPSVLQISGGKQATARVSGEAASPVWPAQYAQQHYAVPPVPAALFQLVSHPLPSIPSRVRSCGGSGGWCHDRSGRASDQQQAGGARCVGALHPKWVDVCGSMRGSTHSIGSSLGAACSGWAHCARLCALPCMAVAGRGLARKAASQPLHPWPSRLPAVEAIDAATGKACQGTRIPTMTTADIQKASSLLGRSNCAVTAANCACKQRSPPMQPTAPSGSPPAQLPAALTPLCAHSAAPSALQSVFVEKNPLGPTVGGIYNSCSHNKSRITMQNSLVAERVRLPCAGNT